MSLEETEAIVLRVYPWSETSCVATLYSHDHGKLSVLAKGARRPKSAFEAALDLLSICRVVFIAKSTDALDILTEAKLQRRFRAGSLGLLRLYCGYYVAELLDRCTDKGDRQPEIYQLARETLSCLEQPQLEPRAIVLRFELGLLRLSGNLPRWDGCAQCGRPTEKRSWIVFGALAGGVLCDSCQLGARQTIRIPYVVSDHLQDFSREDWRGIDVSTYFDDHRAVLRALLNRYWTTLLDRRLQLHAYLEELGR